MNPKEKLSSPNESVRVGELAAVAKRIEALVGSLVKNTGFSQEAGLHVIVDSSSMIVSLENPFGEGAETAVTFFKSTDKFGMSKIGLVFSRGDDDNYSQEDYDFGSGNFERGVIREIRIDDGQMNYVAYFSTMSDKNYVLAKTALAAIESRVWDRLNKIFLAGQAERLIRSGDKWGREKTLRELLSFTSPHSVGSLFNN